MIIYPAIDIINGRCVRLSQGDFNAQKVYAEDPAAMAKTFQQVGLKNLHVVDLDGAKQGRVQQWETVSAIVTQTELAIDFGGGIKTQAEVEKLFALGVKQVNLGSIAYKEPALVKSWMEMFGAGKIILSADVHSENLAVSGWQSQTGMSVFDFIESYVAAGLQYVTCTDISKDGMLAGPGIELYEKILSRFSTIKLIASGGIRSWHDVEILDAMGCYGCIIGKAIYEGTLDLNQIPKHYL